MNFLTTTKFTKGWWLNKITKDRISALQEKREDDAIDYTERLVRGVCMFREYPNAYPFPDEEIFSCKRVIVPDEKFKDDLSTYFFCSKHRDSHQNERTIKRIREITQLDPKDLSRIIFANSSKNKNE